MKGKCYSNINVDLHLATVTLTGQLESCMCSILYLVDTAR
jgi:hypothetical protein